MNRNAITLVLLLLAAPSLALAWNGSPAIVAGVTTTPLLVATGPDGGYGAFIAWQEPSATSPGAGTLRLLHLSADGETDPAWPASGLVLGGGEAPRSAARLVPDGTGGTYAWWLQGSMLRLTRVLADGTVPPGWTTAGRTLGMLTSSEHRPWVQADDAGGIWLGWFQGMRTPLASPSVRVVHLGPDGLGAGGWPSGPRSVPLAVGDECVYSASFDVLGSGGVWALVATGHVVNDTTVAPGDWRLARLTSAGLPDPSLPPEGAVVAPFDATQVGFAVPRIGLGAVAADGAGGVFAALGNPVSNGYDGWFNRVSLRRFLADGSASPQQPALATLGYWSEERGDYCTFGLCAVADYSTVLLRDRAGKLYVGACETYSEIGLVLRLQQLDATGASLGTVAAMSGWGIALHQDSGTGFLISTFDPTGPTHPYFDPGYAYVGVFDTAHGLSYSDQTFSPSSSVYTASDVAALPDGGALLVWARALAPTGLYAVRVGRGGSPLGAGPPQPAVAVGLRLAREGALLRASWGAGEEGVVSLLDVAGRQRDQLRVPPGPGSALFAPPEGLPPGVYFARLVRRNGAVERARVVVLR